MKPADLSKQLEGAFQQARLLLTATDRASTTFLRAPNVTVSFLSVLVPMFHPALCSMVKYWKRQKAGCGTVNEATFSVLAAMS